MSTTFGVYKGEGDIELDNDMLPSSFWETNEPVANQFIIVAFRGNHGYNYWTNPLSRFLSDKTKIYPLDNSAKGIYTIGDFRKILSEY